MEILSVFVFKILDNALSTAKTVLISKEQYLSGSLFNALSFLFYTLAFSKALKDDSMFTTVSMCIAVFIGTYITGVLFKRSERDKLYIFDITSDTLEAGILFADEVRQSNIAIKTHISYDSNINKTLSCKVYCLTKEETKLVNSLIPPGFKYNVYIPLED